ncbi:hypothetical protein GOV11_03915 [Candidatus Woesearchaeota archaeon]|nr:hypothetical protein [Candidatus Woesearchaeota archaeon]
MGLSTKREIRIGQMSDIHLGVRQYGMYERAKDFFNAAMTAAETLVEQNPDLVIIPGDIFHKERPYPVDQRYAIQLFGMFQEHDIPVVVVRGNHDASYAWSRRQGGNEIHVLQDLELVTYLDDEVRVITLKDDKQVRIWGLGYHGSEASGKIAQLVKENAKALKNRSIPNILVVHEFLNNMLKSAEMSEYSLDAHGFDYVAIGHFHNWWVNGAGTMCCTGSTEHVDASEWKDLERSVGVITLKKQASKWKPKVERLTYKVRPKLRKLLELGETSSKDAVISIEETLREIDIEKTIIRIDVTGTLKDTKQPLDIRAIASSAQKAFYVDIHTEFEHPGLPIQESQSLQVIMNEVFVKEFGIKKSESKRWVTLAEEMKKILSESLDTRGESAVLDLLYDFVSRKPVKKSKTKRKIRRRTK